MTHIEERTSKYRYLQTCKTPFIVYGEFLHAAMMAQFDLRHDETAFIARPTRITASTPFAEEYFEYDAEVAIFCMGRNLSIERAGVYSWHFFEKNRT